MHVTYFLPFYAYDCRPKLSLLQITLKQNACFLFYDMCFCYMLCRQQSVPNLQMLQICLNKMHVSLYVVVSVILAGKRSIIDGTVDQVRNINCNE